MARKLRQLDKVALDKHTHGMWRWQKDHNCRECHKLLLNYTNTWQANQSSESKRRYDHIRMNWIQASQNKTLTKPDVANRRWTEWTDWELAIALDPNLTISEKCVKLERTYHAIKSQIRDSHNRQHEEENLMTFRKFANTIEIFSGEGYVADRVHRNTQPGNFWQLSYDIHTSRPGRPTHHSGMYITKSAAEQAARRVIVVQAPKVRNVVLTNTRENY